MLTILAIGSAMTLLIIVSTAFDMDTGNHAPETRKNRMLFLEDLEHNIAQGKNIRIAHTLITAVFAENYIEPMQTIDSYSLYQNFSCNIESRYRPKLANVIATDHRFWQILSFNFIKGRAFKQAECENNEKVLVINEQLAVSEFGTIDVIGKTMKGLNDFKIIGVVNGGSISNFGLQGMWVPYHSIRNDRRFQAQPLWFNLKAVGNYCRAILLIKDGVALKESKSEFQNVLNKMGQSAEIVGMPDVKNLEGKLFDRFDLFFPRGDELYFSLVLFFLIMLIPLTTIVYLINSQVVERFEEIGIRKAFGATRQNIIRQYLFENATITLAGGFLGMVFAFLTMWVIGTTQSESALSQSIPFNVNIVTYSFILCLFLSLLTGTLTVGQLSRVHPVKALKGGEL